MSAYHFTKVIPHPKHAFLEIEFKALDDDSDYAKGHFDDPRDVEWIDDQMDAGNGAAWFAAQVTVRVKAYPELEADDYLWGCSYKSWDDFIQGGDYFDDMVNNATHELLAKLDELKNDLNKANWNEKGELE